jgi:hypothetical protein
MWGGQVSLPTRERFRTANTTEITAIAGQKILFSGRASMMLSSEAAGPEEKSNNGDTIAAKTHAEIGMIAHLSIIRVEDLVRPNSKDCIEALEVLALCWRSRWMTFIGGPGWIRPRLQQRPNAQAWASGLRKLVFPA